MCFNNPSSSALFRPSAISSDFATNLGKLITQKHLTFCEQFGISSGCVSRLIDLSNGTGLEATAVNIPITRSIPPGNHIAAFD
jgi:hypothetical protein